MEIEQKRIADNISVKTFDTLLFSLSSLIRISKELVTILQV